MYVWYVQINAYLLPYLRNYFRAVDQYSHCMRGTSSQCIQSGVVPPLDSKLLVWRTKPPEAGKYVSNKCEIRVFQKIRVIPSGVFTHL